LDELAVHFTNEYERLIRAGMLPACGSKWWLDSNHFCCSWVCRTSKIHFLFNFYTLMHTWTKLEQLAIPGLVLLTDITVTIAMTISGIITLIIMYKWLVI
jgi:hypothetical protein